jgi:hypothetical protein
MDNREEEFNHEGTRRACKIVCVNTNSRNIGELSEINIMQEAPDKPVKEAHEGKVVYHVSGDSTAIEAREKAEKKPEKEGKWEKRWAGRPKKGENRPPQGRNRHRKAGA